MRKILRRAVKNSLPIGSLVMMFCAFFGSAGAEQLPIKTYTIADGLAHDTIVRIVQDSHGFLWFCTAEGLSRFDGYQFKNYGTEQGLPHRVVNDLLETEDGNYWVGTDGGLSYFQPGNLDANDNSRFVSFPLTQDSKPPPISVLLKSRGGTIWCGTAIGLYRLDREANSWRASFVDIGQPAKMSEDRRVHSLLEDRQGSLWIGAETGLYRLTSARTVERYTTLQGLPNDVVRALLEDHEGTLWAGTRKGLCRLVADPTPNRSIVARLYTKGNGLSGEVVNALLQTSDGRLWISGGGIGVSWIDMTAPSSAQPIHNYTTAEGLSDNNVGQFMQDRDGNLWLASESGGAMKLSQGGFTAYQEADGLDGTRIGSIIENQAGALCVLAGVAKPLNCFDGLRFFANAITLPQNVALSWGWYQTVFQDHLGDWWVDTTRGSYRYGKSERSSLPAAQPKKIYTTEDGLPTDEIFRQFEDLRGDVWFSTLGNQNAALARWERSTDKIHVYTPEVDGIPRAAPTAFSNDRAGNLWLGFYLGGVARYHDGRFDLFTTREGIPAGFVRGLYSDSKGRLWVATSQGGAVRIDDPTASRPHFVVLTTANGLASNEVTSIVEDAMGHIYLSSGRGVDRLDPETNRIKHYTTADGLPDNFVNVSFRDRQGMLWFGTLHGMARLLPEREERRLPPPILISRLQVGSLQKPVSELGANEIANVELGSNENRIEAEFVSLSFSSGETLRYQYLLEGADKSWSLPSTQRFVNFANLAPGNYRFLVRALNSDGLASAQPAIISFRVLPPVWRRWWFLTVLAVLIGSAVFALDRYRLGRMRAVDAALAKSKQLTAELTSQRAELSRANQTLALDHDVTQVLAEAETRGEAAPRILQLICERTGWQIGAVWRIDEQTELLRCVAVWNPPNVVAPEFEELTKQTVFSHGAGLPGRVWATGQPVWITDLLADTNFPRLSIARQEGLQSALGFPVLLEGEVLGVIEFFSRHVRQYDEAHLRMMATIGSHLGQLIERKQAEEALRESENRFRTLAETASDAIITIDEESRILFINPAAEHVFGYSVAEMSGANLTMLMPEYLRHLHRAGFSRYLKTGRKHIAWEAVELPGLHKSGREIPLELSFGEFSKNDKRYFTGIARDITERKRSQEELRSAREERLRELERVRKRIATDLHDDIGSALTQISILSEVAHRHLNDASLAAGPLSMIADSSRELIDAMSDIVWAINPQKDHLSDLVGRMRRFASDVLTARNIEFEFQAPQTGEDLQLGANIRREVFLIFKESINNLVKHSECARADIEFHITGNYLTLGIRDNGKGFELNSDGEGHGLTSMRDRAVGLGAEFETISRPGDGTTIKLTVPLSSRT